MIGEIIVNGKSSADYGVYLTDAGIYGMPERDSTSIQVNGRSGDLVIDNGRYKNKQTRFPCAILEDFKENYLDFIGYLLNQNGYARIETSFLPDEYILGRYIGEVEPTTSTDAQKGKFEILFDRKPQRYIIDGEEPVIYTANGTIANNYNGKALPIVRVYGTGAVTIGGITITVNSVDSYVDIDSDMQDAYKGAVNCNGNITLNNDYFFELKPGNNNIVLGSGISKIEIIPRWWRL